MKWINNDRDIERTWTEYTNQSCSFLSFFCNLGSNMYQIPVNLKMQFFIHFMFHSIQILCTYEWSCMRLICETFCDRHASTHTHKRINHYGNIISIVLVLVRNLNVRYFTHLRKKSAQNNGFFLLRFCGRWKVF